MSCPAPAAVGAANDRVGGRKLRLLLLDALKVAKAI